MPHCISLSRSLLSFQHLDSFVSQLSGCAHAPSLWLNSSGPPLINYKTFSCIESLDYVRRRDLIHPQRLKNRIQVQEPPLFCSALPIQAGLSTCVLIIIVNLFFRLCLVYPSFSHIEFVAVIALVLLAGAFASEFGRSRRLKLEHRALKEKPLEWSYTAWWAANGVQFIVYTLWYHPFRVRKRLGAVRAY